MSDNLNSGSLLSSLSGSARPARTTTPMTNSSNAGNNSILPGSMSSSQRQAINREFLDNQTRQTNLLNSNAMLNNLAAQNQGMMNQFNGSLMRQMGAIDAAANKITNAITNQTNQLVSAITNMSSSITESIKGLQEGINNLFYERARAYASKLEYEEDQNIYKDYAENFIKTFFSEKIMNILTSIEFVSLKEVKEQTLKYLMQNGGVAKFLGIKPLGSDRANNMVPFTKDIADAILESSKHLLVIANAVNNINRDTPIILENFGGALIDKQDTLLNINREQLISTNRIGNILDAFSNNYMNVNQARVTEPMRGAIDVIREVTGNNQVQNIADLQREIQRLEGTLNNERQIAQRYADRDDPNSEYNRRRNQLEQDIFRNGGAERQQLREQLNQAGLTQNQRRQITQRIQQLNGQLQVLDNELRNWTQDYRNLGANAWGRNSLTNANVRRSRAETEREVARLERALRTLRRGARNQNSFDEATRNGFGANYLESEIRNIEAYASGRSGRFSSRGRMTQNKAQKDDRAKLMETLRDSINKNVYQTEENTKALNKSISAMDVFKTSLLAAINPMNIKKIGEFGYKLFKFVSPFFMYRWGLQMLTGKSPLPLIGETLPGLLSKPLNYVSSIQLGDKTLGERASGWWGTIKTTLAEFYNNHLKGIWESIKDNLASFKETFIGWIGKDWWMRIYDTWEAVKKYTSLGWDAFLNPDTEKAAIAREQIVTSIKSAMKDVVIKYLLPGIVYGIGAYTAFKNVTNPGKFLSELYRPVKFLGRRFGGGFRTRVYNFNEARTVLQDSAINELQRYNKEFGLSNIRTNLRADERGNPVLTLRANRFGNLRSTNFTGQFNQERVLGNAARTLMDRLGVDRQTADSMLREAATGGGASYRISRLATSIGNGLKNVTRVLSAFMRGTTWVFNIGTTLFSLYKMWNFFKDKVKQIAEADGITGGMRDMVLYATKKGISTLLDVGKEIWKELPIVMGSLWDAGKEAWKKYWPTLLASAKVYFVQKVIPAIGNILEKGINWIVEKAKGLVNMDKESELIKKAEKEQFDLYSKEIKNRAIEYSKSDHLAELGNPTALQMHEVMDALDPKTRQQLLEQQNGVGNNKYIGGVSSSYEGKVVEEVSGTKLINMLLDKKFFNGAEYVRDDKGNIKIGADGNAIRTTSIPFSDMGKVLEALKADRNDALALASFKNYTELLSNNPWLQGTEFRSIFEKIDTTMSIVSDEENYKKSMDELIQKLKTGEVYQDLVRAMVNSPYTYVSQYTGNEISITGDKLLMSGMKLEEVASKFVKNLEEQNEKNLSNSIQRAKLADKQFKDDARRKEEEERARLAEEKARKAAEENEKKEQEKRSFTDSVKSFFGFSDKTNAGGAGSLGVIAQWVQSGKFKQAMETAMGWIGDKIGGIIKFFKSQNYGKIFADTMSGLGSASGAILSALYGADKADTFSRNAYNYAVKHNLKYAKAFFGGARKSILMSVDNIAEHAAKTGQTVQQIYEFLQSQGVEKQYMPGGKEYDQGKGYNTQEEKKYHGKITDANGNYIGDKLGLGDDSDSRFNMARARTFSGEGTRINWQDSYSKFGINIKRKMESKYGILALDVPTYAKNTNNAKLNAYLKNLGIEGKTAKELWGNNGELWWGKGGNREKILKAMQDPNSGFGTEADKIAYMKNNYWNNYKLYKFKDPATSGLLLDSYWVGGGQEVLRNTYNVMAEKYKRPDMKINYIKGKDGKYRWENYKLFDDAHINFANSTGKFFAAEVLRQSALRYESLGRRPDHKDDLEGWRKRVRDNAAYWGIKRFDNNGSYAFGFSDTTSYDKLAYGDDKITKSYDNGDITNETFTRKLNEFIQAQGTKRFDTSFSKILSKTGGSGSEYNRMLKIFGTDEKSKKFMAKVVDIEKKAPSEWTKDEADIMAKFAGLVDKYEAESKSRGNTSTIFYNTITSQTSYITKLLEKYHGNDEAKRTAVNNTRKGMIEAKH